MLLPSHRHHHHPLPLRRGCGRPSHTVHGAAGLTTSSRRAGCLVLLAFAFAFVFFFAAAAAVRHHTPSSSRAHSRRRTEEQGDRRIPQSGGSAPRVTIFSAPLPRPEGSPARQELAVRSWLALSGNVSVVLLGSHPSAFALARRLGRRVTVEAAVDSSFTRTPFFHSMVARAQASDSDICVLVDANIVLLPETVTLLTNFSKVDQDWLLVSVSRNISDFPYHLPDDGKQWVHADGEVLSSKKLQEIPADKWVADSSDRGLVVAWNNPSSPLLAGWKA